MAVFGKKLESFTEQMLLNEAYVGRTPTLELIDRKIAELKEAGPLSVYHNMSRDKRIIELNRLFEKQFGMKIFSLNIINTEEIDAYSHSMVYRLDVCEKYSPKELNKLVKADSRGYYFVPNNELCVIIYMSTGLLFNDTFTSSEILAVLLHEIGHNFSNCLYGKLYIANRESALNYKKDIIISIIIGAIFTPFLIGIPQLIQGIKDYRDMSNGDKRKAQKNERRVGKTGGFFAFINGLKSKYNDWRNSVEEFSYRVADGWDKYEISSPKEGTGKQRYDYLANHTGRFDEVFADKFAAVYGYGPEIALGLAKMDDSPTRADKKIQLYGTQTEEENNLKFEEIMRQLNILSDIHPQTVQRAISDLKLLKRELAKADVDPKLAEAIKTQIKELEDIIDKITTQSEKLSKNDNARRAWNAYINNELPDAVSDKIEEEIEKALDSKLDEYRKSQAKKK